MSAQVTVSLDETDEIDGHYNGPEHVQVWLGGLSVTMTHELATAAPGAVGAAAV